ncbi:MAG: FAD/NAD(P)-binding protein [Syntrophales bacterium]|nr:FAD/NAD(P)-binding protein [Syntrophales bacterium]
MCSQLTDPMLPTPYQVLKRVRETKDTFTLTLAPVKGGQGFPFAPGQFNMLYIFGVGEVPISISGDPDRPEKLVHTVRAVGAVSRAICGLKKGDTLGVRGPYGVPWPVKAAPGYDVLVIAGGLGLAPVRPAVYHLLARRPEYGNLELIYGARTPEDLVYRRELSLWRGRFDFRVHVTVDAARNGWRGNVGVVPNLIARARFDPEQTMALVCGPGVMMRFTVQELVNRGLKMENIYVSLERNMKCGLGLCGHCQLGPFFVCKDGPVFPYDRVRDWFLMREV